MADAAPKADPQEGKPSRSLSEARKTAAWEYALKGKTERWIAEQLERDGLGRVSQPAVHKMVAAMQKRIFADLKEESDRLRARQHARLEHIYAEAMDAWEKSCRPQKTLTTSQDEHGQPRPGATVVIRDSCGDPRHLDAAMKALAGQSKLWGLDGGFDGDAPAAEATVNATVQAQVKIDLSQLSTEDLRAFRDLHRRINQISAPPNGHEPSQN
jgi:hypothetical protein